MNARPVISEELVTQRVTDRPRPRRRPGLMDPDNPQPLRSGGAMTLNRVQRWVASTLAVSTLLHFALGLVLAAYVSDRASSQVGLLVIAAVTGVLSVLAGLAIHERRLLGWWPLLGGIPALVGAYLIFWR